MNLGSRPTFGYVRGINSTRSNLTQLPLITIFSPLQGPSWKSWHDREMSSTTKNWEKPKFSLAFTKNTKICFYMDFYPKLECWKSPSEYPNAPANPESTTKIPRLSRVMKMGNLWLQALGLCHRVLTGGEAVILEILPFLKTPLDMHSCSFKTVVLMSVLPLTVYIWHTCSRFRITGKLFSNFSLMAINSRGRIWVYPLITH